MDSRAVTVERGEKFTAWCSPANLVADLERLGIPYQWQHAHRSWAFPKARLGDLLASLDSDGRRVVLIEVSGR
jgi:hypothetical protein